MATDPASSMGDKSSPLTAAGAPGDGACGVHDPAQLAALLFLLVQD
jgi:hypothetical protein